MWGRITSGKGKGGGWRRGKRRVACGGKEEVLYQISSSKDIF